MAASPHPSRTAPLCKDCAHAMTVGSATTLHCNHPASPVDPVHGRPELRAEIMRRAQSCGPLGALFAQCLGAPQ